MTLPWLDLWMEQIEIVRWLILSSVIAVPIVAMGAMLGFLFRKQAGSFRHVLWLTVSLCVLTSPFATNWVPGLLPQIQASKDEPAIRPARLRRERFPRGMPRSLQASSEVASFQSATNSEPSSDLSAASTSNFNNSPQGPSMSQSKATTLSWSEIFSINILLSPDGQAGKWGGTALLGLWLLGMLVCVLRIARLRFQLASRIKQSRAVVGGSLWRLIQQIAAEEGIEVGDPVGRKPGCSKLRRLHVAIAKNEAGPLLIGIWNAKLLLPASMIHWSKEEQAAAIRHEMAHVVRGDEWVRLYLLALRTVFWFHPCIRYCCSQVQLHAEIACDDHVLHRGHAPSVYSKLLLAMSQRWNPPSKVWGMSGMAMSQVGSRVTAILQADRLPQGRSRLATVTMIGAIMGLSTVAASLHPAKATLPRGSRPSPKAPSSDPQIAGATTTPNANSARANGDWPQWGGTAARNNVSLAKNIPVDWNLRTGKNVRWSAPLGCQSYGGVVVANGKVFAGSNNESGYVKRYPKGIDLGVLLCFNEADGSLLWQHSNEKLPTGRIHDWPSMGICSAPLIEGDRLWYVTNRGEVVCLDTEGFRDGENDGPLTNEPFADPLEADIVWSFDMMKELKVQQHNMANCSVTSAGELLFVCTSEGISESGIQDRKDEAPSFLCLNRETGAVVWTDSSPGKNILSGQWSSPAYAVLGGVPQVIFGGGDGYLYSFLAQGDHGKSQLLWKFDCNPKSSRFTFTKSARNSIIATPVVEDGLVYISVGMNPEDSEGPGHLWCIDPTKRGDVSPTIVYNRKVPDVPIAHKRIQALDEKEGDFELPNKNSAEVWHYVGDPHNFEKAMHRSLSTVAIKNGLLFVSDFSGIVHCIDAKTGKPFWTHDLQATAWASPLIVEDRVYVCDEYGSTTVLRCSKMHEVINVVNLDIPIYTTPIAVNNTLFIAANNRLIAIQEGGNSKRMD